MKPTTALFDLGVTLHGENESVGFSMDLRHFQMHCETAVLMEIARDLWSKIKPSSPKFLCFTGAGGMTITHAIKFVAAMDGVDLSLLYVRDVRKDHGTFRKLVEGPSPDEIEGATGVVVDDLIGSGASAMKMHTILKNEGFDVKVNDIAVIVDFWRGSRKMRAQGWKIHSYTDRRALGLSRKDPTIEVVGNPIWTITNTNIHKNPNMPIKGLPSIKDNLLTFGTDKTDRWMVDKLTGEPLWIKSSRKPAYKGDASTGLFVDDNLVYAGYDGIVHCVNAASGNSVWSRGTQQQVHSSPLSVDGDKILVCSEFNRYSFNVGSGEVMLLHASTGSKIWGYIVNAMLPGTPVVDEINRKVYVGSNSCELLCLDLNSGDIQWRVKVLGTPKGTIILDGDLFFQTNSSYTYCLGVNGKVKWKKFVGGQSRSATPAVDYVSVYSGSLSNYVVCSNREDGSTRWVSRVRGGIWGGPVISKFGILVTTSQGYLYRIDPETGKKLARSTVGKFITQVPVVDGNYVYIVDNAEGMSKYAIL